MLDSLETTRMACWTRIDASALRHDEHHGHGPDIKAGTIDDKKIRDIGNMNVEFYCGSSVISSCSSEH